MTGILSAILVVVLTAIALGAFVGITITVAMLVNSLLMNIVGLLLSIFDIEWYF